MKLAWKELTHSWKKYTLITLIVVLMMFMVLFLSGLVDGLGRAVSAGIENMPVEGFVLEKDAEGLLTISGLSDEQYEEATSQITGRYATVDIMRMYLSKMDSEEKIDVTYFSVDPEGILAPTVFEGVSLADSDAERPLVLNDDFQAEGIAVGDVIRDSTTNLEFTVAGFTHDAMYGHISIAYIPVEVYTELMTLENAEYRQYFHGIALEKLQDDIEVEGLTTMTKSEVIDKIPGYKSEQMTIKMVDWMLVVITAVILAIFFFVINLQKEKEFGVLKAIGINMGRLSMFVLSEVGIIAVFGAVLAMALVYGMAQGLPGSMPFYLQGKNVALILVAFVVISLAGSLLSIVKIARIDPADIIGGDN